jgi:hypothetical protein
MRRAEARGSERVRAASEGALVACGCDGSADAGPGARVAQVNGGRPGARASAERRGGAVALGQCRRAFAARSERARRGNRRVRALASSQHASGSNMV